ncbi:MAG: PaaI family thioesterase [Burkholderiales bacterium]|nr:PaaI family thioesterase [Burkholderiales bacterium]
MNMLNSLQQLMAPLLPGLMGVELSVVEPDRVIATMKVRPDLCTTGETLHGGALMAFADTLGALGTVVNLPPGKRTTTVNSSTQFIAGAKAGSTITGESTPLHRGKTTSVWQTRITSEEGRLCAVVTQTQLVLGP